MKRPTFSKIEKDILKSDPALTKEDPHHKAACFWVASWVVGPSVDKLVKYTGYDRALVEEFADRCKRNKMWIKDKVSVSGTDSVSFWLDVLCVTGLVKRAPNKRVSK